MTEERTGQATKPEQTVDWKARALAGEAELSKTRKALTQKSNEIQRTRSLQTSTSQQSVAALTERFEDLEALVSDGFAQLVPEMHVTQSKSARETLVEKRKQSKEKPKDSGGDLPQDVDEDAMEFVRYFKAELHLDSTHPLVVKAMRGDDGVYLSATDALEKLHALAKQEETRTQVMEESKGDNLPPKPPETKGGEPDWHEALSSDQKITQGLEEFLANKNKRED